MTDEEQDGIREDIVNELIGNPFGAAFGFVAGDVVDDNLALYPRQNDMMGKIGIPIWNVAGNHDTATEPLASSSPCRPAYPSSLSVDDSTASR